jgi:hypothetical protein
MKEVGREMKKRAPWWLFALVAGGALLASGIYIGIMSVEGTTTPHVARAIAFALLGLIMLWGATHSRVGEE